MATILTTTRRTTNDLDRADEPPASGYPKNSAPRFLRGMADRWPHIAIAFQATTDRSLRFLFGSIMRRYTMAEVTEGGEAMTTSAMPINAPCRRLAALNCGPHELYRVEYRINHADGTSTTSRYPMPVTMIRAHRIAVELARVGGIDVWFTVNARVG
jgi:hypothetical protein